jgi:DNA-binding NarL/FixJ family response regulator
VLRQIKDQNIVIVEDDSFIGDSLNEFFQGRNTVRVFGSAEDALAQETSFNDVDVFIVDYKLPAKNGVELFQYLRTKVPTAKYILITGEMNYELAENTRKLGFDALILKPFDYTILEDNISSLISTAA